jgi:hypothetical protein
VWQDGEDKDSFELVDTETDQVDQWLSENQEWQNELERDDSDELEADTGMDDEEDTLAAQDLDERKGWPSPMPFPNLEKR